MYNIYNICHDHLSHTLYTSITILLHIPLYQICVWQQSVTTYATDGGERWWNYTVEFGNQCRGKERAADKDNFNSDCSKRMHTLAGLSWDATMKCVSDSGGYDLTGGLNTLMDAEIEARVDKSIILLPTIIVNGVVERGGTRTAAVLSTICAGFAEHTEPAVCNCVNNLAGNTAVSQCVHALNGKTQPPTPGPAKTPGEEESTVSTVVVLIIIISIVVIMASVGYWHHRRSQIQMRNQVRNILAEYMPLEEGPGSSSINKDSSFAMRQENARLAQEAAVAQI